jgi:predicted dehydrogenase
MTRYRVAVVGLNHYHVTGWVGSLEALSDRVVVVARCDGDPARADGRAPDHIDPSLARQFPGWFNELPFEADLATLIDRHKPDIALVTLPNDEAPGAIELLADAGIHLLLDKPTARTAREAERAFTAVDRAGVRAAVALTRRYGYGWREAADLIASGRIGKLLTTEAVFITSSVVVRDPSNLIFDRERMGGGVLHWLGIHDLDTLQWLTGERIEAVQAMTAAPGESGVQVEEVVSASVRYASGAIGTVHYAYALPRPGGDGYVAIRGTKGSVKVLPDGSWTLTVGGSASEPLLSRTVSYETGPSTGYGAIGAVILGDLLGAIEEGRQPLATGADAASALRVIDAMYASARDGGLVEVRSGK